MRLIYADLVNYRRFRNETGIELDPTLVCVVGPNEAGKSSLIEALAHLDNDRAFQPAEKTRGTPPSATPQVRARFVLEDDDREALADIPEARRVRQLVMWKRGDGPRGYRLEPEPERDFRPRRDVRERLARLRDGGWPPAPSEDDAEETEQFVR
jgi:predicted ATPase